MRYIAAYLLLKIAGKESPTAADVTKVIQSVGIEVDEARLDSLISELDGKDVNAVPSGGGGAAAAPATGGGAPAAAEAKEEKKEEEKVCAFMFSTLPLCLTFTSPLYRKSPMTIWASHCRCNVFISPASCSTTFVGQRLSELWEEWFSQVASAENLYGI
ncbi:60s acidic ribosomal protein-domain-containing protein [Russula emetica]|nr:60s acidic ribosomal protein-domain-containing protein [Russula emetica]